MARSSDALAAALAKVVGEANVRAAGEADAIDGTPAGLVVKPTEEQEVGAVLGVVTEAGATAVARGQGTKLDWGAPPVSVDVVVDLTRLDRLVEHAPGDLVVRAQPGLRLADLAAALRPHVQRLAIDEVVPGSTVGGVIATGLAGPLRLSRGSVRDVLLGITVARADGVIAKAGSRVVKNVAGYDLAKLYAGSFGTLGVVTEAIFRLHPLPRRSLWVTTELDDEASFGRTGRSWLDHPAEVAALEVHRPPGGSLELAALVEGSERGAPVRASALAGSLEGARITEERPPWWGQLPAGDCLLKLTAALPAVPAVLSAVRAAADGSGIPVEVAGSAGVGVLYAAVPSDRVPAVADLLTAARRACGAASGAAVVLRAPREVRAVVDAWGPVPALQLMRRVKAGFDPGGCLAPGRFVGGI